MTNRIRLVLLVATAVAFALVSVAQPAQAAKRAHHNHGRPAAHQVKAPPALAAACSTDTVQNELFGAETGNLMPGWTLADVEAYIGSKGTRLPDGCDGTTRYAWALCANGVCGTAIVAFRNGTVEALSARY